MQLSWIHIDRAEKGEIAMFPGNRTDLYRVTSVDSAFLQMLKQAILLQNYELNLQRPDPYVETGVLYAYSPHGERLWKEGNKVRLTTLDAHLRSLKQVLIAFYVAGFAFDPLQLDRVIVTDHVSAIALCPSMMWCSLRTGEKLGNDHANIAAKSVIDSAFNLFLQTHAEDVLTQ